MMLRNYFLFAFAIILIISCRDFNELLERIDSLEQWKQQNTQQVNRQGQKKSSGVASGNSESWKRQEILSHSPEDDKMFFSKNPVTAADCPTKFGGWSNIFESFYINSTSDGDGLLQKVRCYYEIEKKEDKSILEERSSSMYMPMYHDVFSSSPHIMYTPLMLSVITSRIEVIRYLLAKGADIFTSGKSANNANIFRCLW